MIEWIINEFQTNQFFSGGISIAIFTSALYLLKNLPAKISSLVNKHLIYTIRVNNSDTELYNFVSDWVSKKTEGQTKRIKLVRKRPSEQVDDNPYSLPRTGKAKKSSNGSYFSKTINYGTHYSFSRNGFLSISCNLENSENMIERKEYIVIKFFCRNQNELNDLYNTIEENFKETNKENRIYIHDYDYFRKIKKENNRKINSIFLNNNVKKEVLEDLDCFFSEENKYKDHSFNYKRGYLFYGKPGTGKTSFIKALANYYNKRLYYFNLSEIGGIKELKKLLFDLAENVFIVFEDIDILSATEKREETKNKLKSDNSSSISLQSLLSLLDGDDLPDGTVIFATTNYYENLDPALIRDGRFDVKKELKYADKKLALEMADFFGVKDKDRVEKLSFPISQAELQNIFFKL